MKGYAPHTSRLLIMSEVPLRTVSKAIGPKIGAAVSSRYLKHRTASDTRSAATGKQPASGSGHAASVTHRRESDA